MRRPVLAVAAGVLCALLMGAFVPSSGVRAAADDISERLGDCQDDEIDNHERGQICTRIIDDVSLPEDLRAEALVNCGIVYLEDDKPDLALADFEQAIAFNPSYPVAHAYRGKRTRRKGTSPRPCLTTTLRSHLMPQAPTSMRTAAKSIAGWGRSTWPRPITRRRSGSNASTMSLFPA